MTEFYHKYFTGPNNESNIRQFVKDVVEKYAINVGFDVKKLKGDLASIQTLATAFGDISGEIIVQLIDAEIQMLTTKQEDLSKKINQDINQVQADDKRLLDFLADGQTLDAPKKIQVKPAVAATPTTTPTTTPTETTPPTDEKNLIAKNLYNQYTQAVNKFNEDKTNFKNDKEVVELYSKVNNFEDTTLPKLLGVTNDDLLEVYSKYRAGLMTALIRYTIQDKNKASLNHVKESLDKFNLAAQNSGIKGFKPTNIEELIREHDKLLGIGVKPKSAEPPATDLAKNTLQKKCLSKLIHLNHKIYLMQSLGWSLRFRRLMKKKFNL